MIRGVVFNSRKERRKPINRNFKKYAKWTELDAEQLYVETIATMLKNFVEVDVAEQTE